MRKQTKLVAVLSAAALLAIGASMTSFAAMGWQEEDGTWVYYDKDEYKVTDTWKKSGNYWYYLDEDGYMATSKLVENGDENNNTYYVDETGRMVTNRWIELDNEDYYDNNDDEEAETVWYYFQNSGKAYKTSGDTAWKTINGKKYAFDENGHMLYGWVGKASERIKNGDSSYQTGFYYCGESNDGARVSNDWRKLYVGNEAPGREDSEDDEYWFWFQNNGEKMADKNDKKINGKVYAFDEYGLMISDWNDSAEKSASDLFGYYNDSDNGARQKGWFKAVPSKNINSGAYNDDSAKWFYGNNDGTLVVNQLKTINSKKYAFNDKGEMMSGLLAIVTNGDNEILSSVAIDKEAHISSNQNYIDRVDEVKDLHQERIDSGYYDDYKIKYTNAALSVCYFGTGDDGALKTGNQNVTVDGDVYQFTFGKNGESKGDGLVGLNNNIFYIYGKKVKADTDYRYQGLDYTKDAQGNYTVDPELRSGDAAVGCVLINTSGSVMKGTTYTDSEGRTYRLGEDAAKKKVITDWKWQGDESWKVSGAKDPKTTY